MNKELCPLMNDTSKTSWYIDCMTRILNMKWTEVLLRDLIVTLVWLIFWPICLIFSIGLTVKMIVDIFNLHKETKICDAC